MIIISKLTPKQLREVSELYQICKAYEPLTLSPTPSDAQLFFLQYADKKLVNITSCICFEREAEVYGLTHPDYRKKGFFSAALTALEKKQADLLFIFPTDGYSRDAIACFKTMGASKGATEYLLTCARPYSVFSYSEAADLDVLVREETDIEYLTSIHSQVFDYSLDASLSYISTLCRDGLLPYVILSHSGQTVGLFFLLPYSGIHYLCSFGIIPDCRRKRMASQTLELLIKTDTFPTINKLSVQVSDQNPEALALYQSFGFFTEQALTYYNW